MSVLHFVFAQFVHHLKIYYLLFSSLIQLIFITLLYSRGRDYNLISSLRDAFYADANADADADADTDTDADADADAAFVVWSRRSPKLGVFRSSAGKLKGIESVKALLVIIVVVVVAVFASM